MAAALFSMAEALPNPGREERFKTLTGKDDPVIDYLESAGERAPVSGQA